MMIRKVTDIYGRELEVDESSRKLRGYCNWQGRLTYNAEIVENGEHTGFYTDYIVSGKADDVEERISVWNSKVKSVYAKAVGFAASENDPDRKIWKSVVQYVSKNKRKFFDEYGDLKSNIKLTNSDIRKLVEECEGK